MKLVLGIVLLLACGQAWAGTLRCDDCSETSYRSKANAAGIGTHHVYDLVKAQARKYQVWLDCDDNPSDGRTTCSRQVDPAPVEPEVSAFVLELAAYHQITGGTMKSHFTITANGSVQDLSAFDVVGPGGPRTALFEWFDTTQTASINNALPMIGAAVHSIAVTIASMWNDSMGRTLVTVRFRDGSEITLSYELINSTIEVVPGSAKDKYGNVIPANPADLDGVRFDYSAADANDPARQRMMDYLSLFGVSLPGSGRKWVCVRVSDEQWNCTYI
jgi:hypothetical protein